MPRGRPHTRTAHLEHEAIRLMLQVFGTIVNTHRRLALQLDVPYSTFYRAMQMMSITAAQRDMIMQRWMRWRELYLAPNVPYQDELVLNPMDLNQEPEWMTESKPAPRRRAPSPK